MIPLHTLIYLPVKLLSGEHREPRGTPACNSEAVHRLTRPVDLHEGNDAQQTYFSCFSNEPVRCL